MLSMKSRINTISYIKVIRVKGNPNSSKPSHYNIPANCPNVVRETPEFQPDFPIVQVLSQISGKVTVIAGPFFFLNHARMSIFPAATVAMLWNSTRHYTSSSL